MRLLIPLFSPPMGTWGGLTRVVAIAEAARQAGHDIAFCAAGTLEAHLRKRGYTVYPAPPTTMLGLPTLISRFLEQRSQHASLPVQPGVSIGNWWMVLVLSGMARADYLRRLVQGELEAAEDFHADTLFTDGDPGAFVLASVTGMPLAWAYAGLVTLGVGSWPWRLMYRALASTLKFYGQPDKTPSELFGRSVLKIVPSIPELDGTDTHRPDVRYVGHLLGDIQPDTHADWPVDDGRRYVFVYMGSGTVALDKVEKVLSQLFPPDGKVIGLVGSHAIKRPYRLNAVEFRPCIPAETVLPHCDWTLCHGGQNTIIQSLRQDVPLIIFPGPILERRFNARRVQRVGAGTMGEVNQFTPGWLSKTMEQRAERAPHAARLGERIRSYGGAPAAIEAISQWNGQE
jgi:UDP:flavonoid glycosyltransferase YjiC (YdhE family)